ncbi:MAG: hypothetical protein AAGI30_07745 [Planctomycetota bacterium]
MMSKDDGPNRSWRGVVSIPLLGALLAGVGAYLAAALSAGFLSDDYYLIFGNGLYTVDSLWDAFGRAGRGHVTFYRPLTYPIIGYGGLWFGEGGAHLVALGAHLLAAAGLYSVVRAIGWGTGLAGIVAGVFAASPMVAQGVVWWSAIGCTVGAAIMFWTARLSLVRPRGVVAHVARVGGVFVGILIALMVYEVWVAAPLFVFALEAARAGSERPTASIGRFVMVGLTAAKRSWWTGVPAVLWFAGYIVTFAQNPEANWRPLSAASPEAYAKSLVFVHLRVPNWVLDLGYGPAIDWRGSIGALPGVLTSPIGLVSVLAGVCGVVVLVRAMLRREGDAAADARPVWLWLVDHALAAYLIAWATTLPLFARATGVFPSRVMYGVVPALALALVAALVVVRGGPQATVLRRVLAGGALGVALGLSLIASIGAGQHYAAIVRAEAVTNTAITSIAPDLAGGGFTHIVVVGSPVVSDGELDYYSEEGGLWLDWHVRRAEPGLYSVFAERAELDVAAGSITLVWTAVFDDAESEARSHPLADPLWQPAHSGRTKRDVELPLATTAVFAWHRGELRRVGVDGALGEVIVTAPGGAGGQTDGGLRVVGGGEVVTGP